MFAFIVLDLVFQY